MITSETRRLIQAEIENYRRILTSTETWLQQQPWARGKDAFDYDPRTQGFRRLNFWRNVLRDAEKRLEAMDVLVDKP